MNIQKLCELLDIPLEVQKKLYGNEKVINMSGLSTDIEHMKNPGHWETALEHLKEKLGPDDDGMKILYCQLHCVCDAYVKYQEVGISEKIFVDTMKFFTRFLNEHKERHGCYRYVWAWWAVRQISMIEYRIGELEYEMRLENGERVIDLHIPSDADLSIDKLRKSYEDALVFIARYFPEYKGADMICSSWLLSPMLKNVLPNNSRILKFQQSFEIGNTDEESLGFMDWVYGSREIPLEDLPEKTSLQKNLKSYLRNQGKIGWTNGKLVENPFA